MLEAIKTKDNLINRRNRVEGELKSKRIDLERLLSGKKTISSVFSMKSKSDDITLCQRTVDSLEKEYDILTKFVQVVTNVLA